MKPEQLVKIVIKSIPTDTFIDDINEEFNDLGCTPSKNKTQKSAGKLGGISQRRAKKSRGEKRPNGRREEGEVPVGRNKEGKDQEAPFTGERRKRRRVEDADQEAEAVQEAPFEGGRRTTQRSGMRILRKITKISADARSKSKLEELMNHQSGEELKNAMKLKS
ncbi:hypothetical protein NPIL_475271 [Nephila pilipes]|uniref:Uncharacterized protein n=1 Tax=Nephila pilipes TaxID=299642 RepID=A0A8X6MRA1_NEPPI|nr:hypothetical protein NPIL_475271 [Nephila pilipes]